MESVASSTQSPVSEVLTPCSAVRAGAALHRRELFLPMPVDRYVESAALFRRLPGQKAPELVAPATKINLSTLVSYAGHGGGTDLELHFVGKPLSRAAYRRWRRRPDRPRFQGGSPFAMVGMFGRPRRFDHAILLDRTGQSARRLRGGGTCSLPGSGNPGTHVLRACCS